MANHAHGSSKGMGMAAVLVAVAMIPVLVYGIEDAPPPEVAVAAAALPHRFMPSASARPWQAPVAPVDVPLGHGKTAHLKQAYAIEGAVLTRRRHRLGPHSDISPLDLGIVTGPNAASDRMAHLRGGTAPRIALLRFAEGAPADLVRGPHPWFTNNHLIPATAAVRDALLAVGTGDRVRIEGFLADVTGMGLAPWRTSERRQDTWCEIVVVTAVHVGDATPAAPVVRRAGRTATSG
ncbi:hypothetical protein JQC91_10300 [Jannaschia sp. Os4]|uniref:hypothetical protein n=1 Tax=Jannaschia sp. Os4 TaxID=2807617 RepID=UPI00193A88E4|nr:hypothetical protein [Jannaschia sp. Os4]MBM2576694.1 hypothetical protein [Jannaschia sp. Os4]